MISGKPLRITADHIESLSVSLLRRFQVESGILGRLRHAGIAQDYTAGTSREVGPGGPLEIP